MPELPEVETIRAGLEPLIVRSSIESVTVSHPRTARHQLGGPAELADALTGVRIEEVARRGKFLWFVLSDGGALLAHLGMSGQFRVFDEPCGPSAPARPEALDLRHERARLDLVLPDGRHRRLFFCDQRTFGYLARVELIPTVDGGPGGRGSVLAKVPAPARLIARDLLDPALDRPALARRLSARTRGIKHLLLDQNLVSGVGNIYADEALWRARSHGLAPANALGARRIGLLLGHASDVMSEALSAGGTSFDPLYVNVNGASGYFSRSLAVYGQAGQPCPRCGTAIRRVKFAGRSSHFCPRCQPPPDAAPAR